MLDYELGYMTNSITAMRVQSAEMARMVEIMVRWPWLLDALGARRPMDSEVRTVLADLMRASGNDEKWAQAAAAARMDLVDESTTGLRELLQRRGTEPETLIAIAGEPVDWRYLWRRGAAAWRSHTNALTQGAYGVVACVASALQHGC